MSVPTASQVLADLLAQCQQQTTGCIEGCPEDRHLFCLGDGKATPLWLVGHLGCIADVLGRVYGLGREQIFPQDWRRRFTPASFGGSPITTDPGDYPSWSELAEAYDRVMTAYVKELREVEPAILPGPSLGETPEALRDVIPTLVSSVTLNILHDGHHRGQLALLANSPAT